MRQVDFLVCPAKDEVARSRFRRGLVRGRKDVRAKGKIDGLGERPFYLRELKAGGARTKTMGLLPQAGRVRRKLPPIQNRIQAKIDGGGVNVRLGRTRLDENAFLIDGQVKLPVA